jgi:CHAD domain-containing protein
MGAPVHARLDRSIDPHDPAGDVFCAVLAQLAVAIEDNVAGTLADADPEFLHELRVSVRRTRSVLAGSRGIIPKAVRQPRRRAFDGLAAVTGPARDLDVYVHGWHSLVAGLPGAGDVLEPVLAELDVRRVAAHACLDDHLRAPEHQRDLAAWRRWLAAPPELGRRASSPVGPLVAARIERAQRRVLEHGRAIDEASPGEELHGLRKEAKVLRYLLECFGGLFEPAPRRAFVARLKVLQDNLGGHQDAEVQSDQLRRLARDLHGDAAAPDVLVALGQLTEQIEERRRAARSAFQRCFADYDAKPARRALRDALARAAAPAKR